MSENLMEAHHQFATRNPDERYWDVNEFETTMRDRESRQSEIKTTVQKVTFIADGDGEDANLGVQIYTPDGMIFAEMNNLSFTQMARRLEYPTRGLDPELLSVQTIAQILNERVERSDPETSLLLLTQMEEGGRTTIKSVTSDAYARLNNSACVPFLRRLESYNFRLPPARPVGFENERLRVATESDVIRNNRIGGGMAVQVGDLIAPAGLYAGDEDFFAFMIADDDESLVDDGKGNSLMQGYMMRNSDVGVSSFEFSSFVMAGVCGNHIIWDAKNIINVKYRHIGEAVERIGKDMAKFTPNSTKDSLDDLRMTMAWMGKQQLGTDVNTVIESVKQIVGNKTPVLTEKAMMSIYANAAHWREQDGDPNYFLGYVQAITRWSQTLPFQNVRKEFDKAAGTLIAYARKQSLDRPT